MKARRTGLLLRRTVLTLVCVSFLSFANAQSLCPYQYGDMVLKQAQIPNLNIPGADNIKGYIEYLPSDYYTNPSKTYPLLIYVHGLYQVGTGQANDPNGLCLLYGDSQWYGIPTDMAEGWPEPFPDSVSDPVTGKSFSFILISPQFSYFGNEVPAMNAFLDYLLARYRADPTRIYVTGISAGADFLLSYVQSSVAAASRIAAFAPVSPCDDLYANGPSNIAQANLPVWGYQCITDGNCGMWVDPYTHAQSIANSINTQIPAPNPLANTTIFPLPTVACDPDVSHDTWRFAYNQYQTLNLSLTGTPINLYQWMLQFTRSTPAAPTPTTFQSFSANLSNNTVYLRWVAARQVNAKEYTVEKAGDDRQFKVLETIPVKTKNSNGLEYETRDNNPLPHTTYYRISQTDRNGRRHSFEIRKVINRTGNQPDLVVLPNPVSSKLSAFITLNTAQHLTAVVMDINGRKLRSIQGQYPSGGTEIVMNMDGLSAGVYFLKIEGEGFSRISKVIKQ